MSFSSVSFRAAFCIAGLCVAPMFTQTVAAQNVATVATGKLQGVTDNRVTAFKGIPYAAPPVGNLRWRPPQPAPTWVGIRSAAHFGNDCMQLVVPSDHAIFRAKLNEDCLVLNVWAPKNYSGRRLPVMVWVYGGGWVNGGTSPEVFDGTQFAHDGVVFVSFNYRLGRFGFFAHPALTREDPDGLLGNYGYMDQLAALKWVQKNIGAFGGDPHNVTLFGESAGGFSVDELINSPLSHGLFQKAIMESGAGRKALGRPSLKQGSNGGPSAQDLGLAFAKSKGISGEAPDALEKLRALPADSIVDGLNMDTMLTTTTYSGPMIDGKIVTEEPQVGYLSGTQAHIPLMVGANSLEVGVTIQLPQIATSLDQLFAPFGKNAAAARKAFDPDDSGNLTDVANRLASVSFVVEPTRFVARTTSNAGQPVWEYRFSYVAESMRREWSGAPHNSELWYVFDTLHSRYGSAVTPGDESMARAIHAYWVQFAKMSNPNRSGLSEWPQYSPGRDVLMNFTNNGPVAESDPWKERLNLTEALQ